MEKQTAQEWIKSIDIWDPKYDYVMHNDHWLTSDYCKNCPQCNINSHKTNNNLHVKSVSSPIDISKETPVVPAPIIPVTPIAPAHQTKTNFVTPATTNKFNDTFTRSAQRQTARKVTNQQLNNHQDLINLNETFDLYKSALEESPPTGVQHLMQPFDNLLNYNTAIVHQDNNHQDGMVATSRIPRIPVKRQ